MGGRGYWQMHIVNMPRIATSAAELISPGNPGTASSAVRMVSQMFWSIRPSPAVAASKLEVPRRQQD